MSTCNFLPKVPKGLTFTPDVILPGMFFVYRSHSTATWRAYLALGWVEGTLEVYDFHLNKICSTFERDEKGNYDHLLRVIPNSDVTLNFQVW